MAGPGGARRAIHDLSLSPYRWIQTCKKYTYSYYFADSGSKDAEPYLSMKPILLLALSAGLLSCGHTTTADQPLRLDQSIRTKVLEHLVFPHPSRQETTAHFYENRYFTEWFTNDSLEYSTYDSTVSQTFRSYYEWKEDTLVITGGYGWLTGLLGGFEIRVHNYEVQVFNKLCSANTPAYKLEAAEPEKFILNIPTTDAQVVLSELPKNYSKTVLYGYVTFKGTNFYRQKDSLSEKHRMNMKAYFRSTPLP